MSTLQSDAADSPDVNDLIGIELMGLGHVLSTGAPVSPERTRAAVQAMTTSASYLAVALGSGLSASVPAADDLDELLVGLHVALNRLHTGLHQLRAGIGRRQVASELPITEVAKLQSVLKIAVDQLGTSALSLGAASDVIRPVLQQ